MAGGTSAELVPPNLSLRHQIAQFHTRAQTKHEQASTQAHKHTN